MQRRRDMWNEVSVGAAQIREAIDAGTKERVIYAMENSMIDELTEKYYDIVKEDEE